MMFVMNVCMKLIVLDLLRLVLTMLFSETFMLFCCINLYVFRCEIVFFVIGILVMSEGRLLSILVNFVINFLLLLLCDSEVLIMMEVSVLGLLINSIDFIDEES